MVGKAAKAKGEANALEPPPAEEAEAALEEDGGSGAKEGSSLLDHVRELYPLGSDAAKGGLSAADVLAALSARDLSLTSLGDAAGEDARAGIVADCLRQAGFTQIGESFFPPPTAHPDERPANDAEAIDAEANDAEAIDAEANDAEAIDAEANDAEANDAEAEDAEAKAIEQPCLAGQAAGEAGGSPNGVSQGPNGGLGGQATVVEAPGAPCSQRSPGTPPEGKGDPVGCSTQGAGDQERRSEEGEATRQGDDMSPEQDTGVEGNLQPGVEPPEGSALGNEQESRPGEEVPAAQEEEPARQGLDSKEADLVAEAGPDAGGLPSQEGAPDAERVVLEEKSAAPSGAVSQGQAPNGRSPEAGSTGLERGSPAAEQQKEEAGDPVMAVEELSPAAENPACQSESDWHEVPQDKVMTKEAGSPSPAQVLLEGESPAAEQVVLVGESPGTEQVALDGGSPAAQQLMIEGGSPGTEQALVGESPTTEELDIGEEGTAVELNSPNDAEIVEANSTEQMLVDEQVAEEDGSPVPEQTLPQEDAPVPLVVSGSEDSDSDVDIGEQGDEAANGQDEEAPCVDPEKAEDTVAAHSEKRPNEDVEVAGTDGRPEKRQKLENDYLEEMLFDDDEISLGYDTNDLEDEVGSEGSPAAPDAEMGEADRQTPEEAEGGAEAPAQAPEPAGPAKQEKSKEENKKEESAAEERALTVFGIGEVAPLGLTMVVDEAGVRAVQKSAKLKEMHEKPVEAKRRPLGKGGPTSAKERASKNSRCIHKKGKNDFKVQIKGEEEGTYISRHRDAIIPDPCQMDDEDYKKGLTLAEGYLDGSHRNQLNAYPSQVRAEALKAFSKSNLEPVWNVGSFFLELCRRKEQEVKAPEGEKEVRLDHVYTLGCKRVKGIVDFKRREMLMKVPRNSRRDAILGLGAIPYQAICTGTSLWFDDLLRELAPQLMRKFPVKYVKHAAKKPTAKQERGGSGVRADANTIVSPKAQQPCKEGKTAEKREKPASSSKAKDLRSPSTKDERSRLPKMSAVGRDRTPRASEQPHRPRDETRRLRPAAERQPLVPMVSRPIEQPRSLERLRPMVSRPIDQPRPVERLRPIISRPIDLPHHLDQPRHIDEPRHIERPQPMERSRPVERLRPIDPPVRVRERPRSRSVERNYCHEPMRRSPPPPMRRHRTPSPPHRRLSPVPRHDDFRHSAKRERSPGEPRLEVMNEERIPSGNRVLPRRGSETETSPRAQLQTGHAPNIMPAPMQMQSMAQGLPLGPSSQLNVAPPLPANQIANLLPSGQLSMLGVNMGLGGPTGMPPMAQNQLQMGAQAPNQMQSNMSLLGSMVGGLPSQQQFQLLQQQQQHQPQLQQQQQLQLQMAGIAPGNGLMLPQQGIPGLAGSLNGVPAVQPVKLTMGGCRVPDPARETEQDPRMKMNEDAFSMCNFTFSVADGLGGTMSLDVSSARYAEEIAHRSSQALEELATRARKEGQAFPSPTTAIEWAHSQVTVQGATTVCLLALDSLQSTLHAAKIGDGGYVVLRPSTGLLASTPLPDMSIQSPWAPFKDTSEHPRGVNSTHYLTSPDLQSRIGGVHPRTAIESTVRVAPGDVIVAATDGFFDSVYLHGERGYSTRRLILERMSQAWTPQQLAEQLVLMARAVAQEGSPVCPFAEAARAQGDAKHGGGARPDDIAVVVAYVQSNYTPLGFT